MRKVLIITSLLAGLFLCCRAQTTQEEYNYVTRGYKEQLVTGGDIMKGYKLEDVDSVNDGERFAFLRKLIKTDGKRKKTAAYMVVVKQKTRSDDYFCIPLPNSSAEIKNMYEQAIHTKYAKYNMSLIIVLLSQNLVWN